MGWLQRDLWPRGVLGVSLEADRLVVAQVRRQNGRCRLVRRLAVDLPEGLALEQAAEAGGRLAERLREAGIREKRCAVCLPPNRAMSASVDVPAVSDDDIRTHLELRAEREFPLAPGDLRLAHSICPLPGGGRRATLAALPAKQVEAVERLLEAAGCRAVSMGLGMERVVGEAGPGGSVSFVADGNHVDVVVCVGGGVAALRSLPGGVVAADLSREIRLTLGRLPDELRGALREARFLGEPVAAAALRRMLEEPLRRLGIEPGRGVAPAAGTGEPDPPDVALGAATRYLEGRPAPFEFIRPQTGPLRMLSHRFHSLRLRWVGAAAVALAAVAVGLLAWRGYETRQLAAQWAAMEPTVSELRVLQKNIRDFRPWFDTSTRSLEILDGLTSAFPEDGVVWAKTVEIRENRSVTCSGSARTQEAFMETLDRLRRRAEVDQVQVQQVRGSAPVQFTFSFVWRQQDEK